MDIRYDCTTSSNRVHDMLHCFKALTRTGKPFTTENHTITLPLPLAKRQRLTSKPKSHSQAEDCQSLRNAKKSYEVSNRLGQMRKQRLHTVLRQKIRHRDLCQQIKHAIKKALQNLERQIRDKCHEIFEQTGKPLKETSDPR